MMIPALLACLALAPAHAEVELIWGPVIGAALPKMTGPGLRVTRGFDSAVLKGLEVRYNEVQVLGEMGVRDLSDLKTFLASPRPDGGGSRMEDLQRSLEILAPVIRRLEAMGVTVDEFARPSSELAPLLSQALSDVARDTDIRARKLAARYEGEELSPNDALEDSKEADAIVRDGYPYLTIDVFHRLAQVYDPARSERLAALSASAEPESLAIVTPEDRETMVDAVAERPNTPKAKKEGFWARLFSVFSK